jgi:hypothetical protein
VVSWWGISELRVDLDGGWGLVEGRGLGILHDAGGMPWIGRLESEIDLGSLPKSNMSQPKAF